MAMAFDRILRCLHETAEKRPPNRANVHTDACYERCAMILTSNRGFAEWGDILGDHVVAAALLNRLLNCAAVVRSDALSKLVEERVRRRQVKLSADSLG